MTASLSRPSSDVRCTLSPIDGSESQEVSTAPLCPRAPLLGLGHSARRVPVPCLVRDHVWRGTCTHLPTLWLTFTPLSCFFAQLTLRGRSPSDRMPTCQRSEPSKYRILLVSIHKLSGLTCVTLSCSQVRWQLASSDGPPPRGSVGVKLVDHHQSLQILGPIPTDGHRLGLTGTSLLRAIVGPGSGPVRSDARGWRGAKDQPRWRRRTRATGTRFEPRGDRARGREGASEGLGKVLSLSERVEDSRKRPRPSIRPPSTVSPKRHPLYSLLIYSITFTRPAR